MKRYYYSLITSLLVASSLFYSDAKNYTFNENSQLASGKWIKVKVSDSGIYEISYEDLRKMGFSNPDKVGVYGKGGKMMSMTFADRYGALQVSDDIEPVAVLHWNDKIYFYGKGTEDIKFNVSGSPIPSFEKVDNNIYSASGAYFLTDKDSKPLEMDTMARMSGIPTLYNLGYDYVYHEAELSQNSTNTGQLFWGESLISGTSKYTWRQSLPYLDLSTAATLDCKIYASQESEGSLSFGVTDAEGNAEFDIVPPSSANFKVQATSSASITIPQKNFTVFTEATNAVGDFVNLDYWILSYAKYTPDFTAVDTEQQQRIFFPAKGTSEGYIVLNQNKPIIAFDVTNTSYPRVLPMDSNNENDEKRAYFTPNTGSNNLIICNTQTSQLQIDGYEEVNNTNLHALASKGADLLIISTPYFYKYAEEIAEIHRKYDGLQVTVANVNDVYNEFSAGIPDPMAYRAFVKMLYQSSSKSLKNLLLLGPIYGDIRAAYADNNRMEGLIGFQESVVTEERDASNAMDFYGMTADYIHTSSIQDEDMQVGVGLLPCFTAEDAKIAVEKIKQYVSNTDFAEVTNEILSIGGTEDSHTHDYQAQQISTYINSLAPTTLINPTLIIDAYGYQGAKDKFIGCLDQGKIFTYYHGHGAARMLGKTTDFFQTADALQLKNKHLGFMYVGGCDLSLTDHAERGIGEHLVLSTPHGMAGMIIATRTTWSGQNFDFSRRLTMAMLREKSNTDNLRSVTPTIGEVFADAKTASPYANELCYILVGDPALKIPVALRKISLKLNNTTMPGVGEYIDINGRVLDTDGTLLSNYSGDVVLKLMQPAYTQTSADYITNTAASGTTINVTYADNCIQQVKATVTDGVFDAKIMIPSSADQFIGQSLRLHIGAYDPTLDLGAAGYGTIALSQKDNVAADTSAPTLSAQYDAASRIINVYVSDDNDLLGDCLAASMANKESMNKWNVNGNQYSCSSQAFMIPVDNLSEGNHSISLTASDAAGNKTTIDYDFNVEKWSAPLTLTATHKAVADKASFEVVGSDAEEFTLTVINSKGEIVFNGVVPADDITWDCTNNNGEDVPNGLYQAKVTTADNSAGALYSGWCNFGVMQ